MESLVKLNKEQIITNVNKDLVGRDAGNVENLKKFYFKILTEETIRTSSFRYVYAKIAFEIICNVTNDTESLDNFNQYNRQKVSYEIANPAIKTELPEKPKKPLSEAGQRFIGAVKTTQFKF